MAGIIHPQFHNSDKVLDAEDGSVSPPSETSEDTTSSEEAHSPKMKDDTENGPGADNETAAGSGDQSENVLVIDTTFTCRIVAPGMDPFEIKVSSEEIVQEIRNMLMDTEEQCHRTCFALQLIGNTLDAYTELKNIPGMKEGAEIKVLEDLYTVREARFHVKRIKEILTSCDLADSYTGSNMSSLSFVNGIWSGDGNNGRKKAGEGSVDCTPPEYIMPKSKERPLLPLHPNLAENKTPACIKILSYNHWNPPPSYRKLHGDLLYLQITTLEEKKYHATASTKGFYINQTTDEEFNPKPSPNFKTCHHSLVDLLSMISPAFKRNWSSVVKKRYAKHIYERMPTPYQVYSWLAPQPDHTIDLVRMEDGLMTGRLGYEDNLPSGSRDWNEEFQIVKELPKKTLPERVDRERSHFKVNSDFVWASTRGAQLVVDGCLMPINPGEETKMQMFIWNNIFFSMGFDVKDHYKDFGGDYAAHVAPAKDLQGVKAYQELDIDGLCTLGTVVVDYRGYRITAQSIIPGILEKEQEQSVVQGSIDFGKTVVHDSRYKDLLEKAAQTLRIRPHKVINHQEETIELYSSVDCKGIVGNDGRLYILDLLRTFPIDINYVKCPEGDEIEISEDLKKAGYPQESRHSFVTLRQELVDAFVDMRYMGFVRTAALLLEQQRQKKEAENAKEQQAADNDKTAEKALEDSKASEDKELTPEVASSVPADDETTEKAKQLVETLLETKEKEEKTAAVEEADLTETVLKRAAKAVGSLSEKEFNISFNPDLYQPKVTHAEPDSDAMKTDKAMLNKITEFLVFHQIPAFIQTCSDHTLSPVDGQTLTESLHTRGINVRYLGRIANLIKDIPTLSYLYAICTSEMVCRSAKHLFNRYMHCTDTTNIAAGIAHFLNCLLSSCSLPTSSPYSGDSPNSTQNKAAKKKSKKGKSKQAKDNALERSEWGALVPKTLWEKLSADVKEHFNFSLSSDSIDTACDKYKFQKISLLRAFCQRVGIQILLREYNFDNRTRQPFYEDDIINMYPVVKHVSPKATDAYRFFTSGQAKIQQGMFKEGYELITESLNLLSVYGPMHSEIAACCRLLGRLNYLMGDFEEALSYQQKAAIMNERCLGIDHPSTITDYVHLAIYSFANNQISSALQVLYRARYLLLLSFGENHPDVALVDINIGLILNGVGEYELACNFISNAKDLFTTFYGASSLKVATAFHLLARSYSCRGDFRTALGYEKSAYVVYNQRLGETHEKTRESSECLKHLTHQAVVFQKKMVELGKGDKGVGLPAIQAILQSIQVPSVRSILDTLNVVNGIAVPVPISPVARPVTVSSKEVKQEITAAENEPTIEFPASKVAVTDDLD